MNVKLLVEMQRIFDVNSQLPLICYEKDKFYSYKDLEDYSNLLAQDLLGRGIKIGDRIAVVLEKCLLSYVIPLAALKIGAPYIYLDPSNPGNRIDKILDICDPSVVFAAKNPPIKFEASKIIECGEGWHWELSGLVSTDSKVEDVSKKVNSSDPAYIMFTSGSTGEPKGAVISHGNLVSFIDWIRNYFKFKIGDVHANLNPMYFDNSIFDFYSTIFTGGCLVPFDSEEVRDVTRLVKKIKRTKCSVWFSVPSLLIYMQVMGVATKENLGGLKNIIFGGESYPKKKLKELFYELGDKVDLTNVYGPTECTCICSAYKVNKNDFIDLKGIPPLGEISSNFNYYILDENSPVAKGEIGELCLSGDGVGYGYFNRMELSSKSFVQNPLNQSFKEIIYRTGDLVRIDPTNHLLEFVCRKDSQIKHMGYRIELDEISWNLSSLSGINEVFVFQKITDGLSEIVAVVAGGNSLDSTSMKMELNKKIPKYMVPNKIIIVSELPKNKNGKIDGPLIIKMQNA
jgi:D-alanine--poly(phosphoribitol) ligase subunit 1